MERHEILDAMSELKLYSMRASFDEIAGKGLVRRDEIYPRRQPDPGRAHAPPGSVDQLPHQRRQVPGVEGSRQLRLRRHARRSGTGA